MEKRRGPGRPKKQDITPEPALKDISIPDQPPPELGLTQAEWDSLSPQYRLNALRYPEQIRNFAAGKRIRDENNRGGSLPEKPKYPLGMPGFHVIEAPTAAEMLEQNEPAFVANALHRIAKVANGQSTDYLDQTLYRDMFLKSLNKPKSKDGELNAAGARARVATLRELKAKLEKVPDAEFVVVKE